MVTWDIEGSTIKTIKMARQVDRQEVLHSDLITEKQCNLENLNIEENSQKNI